MIAITTLFATLPARATEHALDRKVVTGAVVMTNALIDRSADCSRRYHAKLSSVVLPGARAVLAIADKMRQANRDMPGYWLFWDGNGVLARNARQRRLLATPQLNILENRMCVRSILARGGRIRCLKWKPVPAGYKPPPPVLPTTAPSKPETSATERRFAAAVSARVISKGAFRELGHGTAFYHMAQRTNDELIAYASQPHRATICTGVNEVIGFYQRQLQPLWRKASRAARLLSETQKAALAAARAALPAQKQIKPSIRPDFVILARKLLISALKEHEFALIAARASPFGALTEAREILSDQRFDAMTAELRVPLRKALRNIEFALYARYSALHTRQFAEAFELVFQEIRAAHSSECTCEHP